MASARRRQNRADGMAQATKYIGVQFVPDSEHFKASFSLNKKTTTIGRRYIETTRNSVCTAHD
jgi:hypothetical protein